MSVSKIKNNPNNPRLINDDKFIKLVKSVKQFPQMLELRPIVVNKDMIVLGGNMRLKACIEAGIKEVPVIVADNLTEEQQKEFIIKDNVSGGEWDWSVLANEWDQGELVEWGVDLPVVKIQDEILDTISDEGIPSDIRTITKYGDIWEFNNHKLVCGDSTSQTDIEKLLNGCTCDVYVFDPPYDLVELYQNAMPVKNNDSQKLVLMWDFKRFGVASHMAIEAGWNPLYEFIWDCCQSWYTPNRPLARHKSIGIFGDNEHFNTDLAIIKDGKNRGNKKTVKNTRGSYEYTPLDGAKHISTVEQFSNCQERDEHGHGKPVSWITPIFAGIGGNIYLDLFGGSGSTIIACEKLNKKSYTMEIEPKNCDMIVQRYKKFCEVNNINSSFKLNNEIYLF